MEKRRIEVLKIDELHYITSTGLVIEFPGAKNPDKRFKSGFRIAKKIGIKITKNHGEAYINDAFVNVNELAYQLFTGKTIPEGYTVKHLDRKKEYLVYNFELVKKEKELRTTLEANILTKEEENKHKYGFNNGFYAIRRFIIFSEHFGGFKHIVADRKSRNEMLEYLDEEGFECDTYCELKVVNKKTKNLLARILDKSVKI